MDIETFLKKLELGNYTDIFKKSGYQLGILKEKCDDELRKMIEELKLPLSTQDLIISEIQTLKITGKYNTFQVVHYIYI